MSCSSTNTAKGHMNPDSTSYYLSVPLGIIRRHAMKNPGRAQFGDGCFSSAWWEMRTVKGRGLAARSQDFKGNGCGGWHVRTNW